MSEDPYSYPGTDVLRNKLGIRDSETLSDFEHQKTTIRSLIQREQPIKGNFDLAHLQAIHKDLFKDVYDWAGQLRSVSISKGGSAFAHPGMIESYASSTVFKDLKKDNYLRGMNEDKFASRLAHHTSEINALHPFREGNGRSTRIFIEELAKQAGYKLDYTQVDAKTWNDASRHSFNGNLAPLEKILRENIKTLEMGGREATIQEIVQSRKHLNQVAADIGIKSLREASLLQRDIKGEVVAVTSHHALVNLQGNVGIVFESKALDRKLEQGEQVHIRYAKTLSQVLDKNAYIENTNIDKGSDRTR